MADDDAPKIQIDSDWKKEAAAEKERLAKEADNGGAGEAVGPEGLPEPSFQEILATFASQVSVFLGELADPVSGRQIVSLPIAKHFIDLIGILDEKTRGNLSDREKEMLDQLLYNARMRYVQLAGGGMPRSRGSAPPDEDVPPPPPVAGTA